MLNKIIKTSAALLTLGYLVSCSKQVVEDIQVDPYQPEASQPVATVSGKTITKGELAQELV
ncbi:MAG: hypothetical protein OXE99_14290 [Cellvibrionales bacterium]|nr:hypothetical protein [Cellvibrionales bacterium]